MLPIEMWEEILKNLEIFELMKMKTVSKTWRDMINRIIKTHCKWHEKCRIEIPQAYWSSILEHQTDPELSYNNFHESKMHHHIWISMYESWCGWKNLLKKTPRMRVINIYAHMPQDEPNCSPRIVCLRASANIIAIATNFPEHLIVYDISEMSEEPIYEDFQLRIRNIEICRRGNDVTIVSSPKYGQVQCWDINKKKREMIHQYRAVAPCEYTYSALLTSTAGCYVLIHDWDQREPPERKAITWNIEKLSCGLDLRVVLKKQHFEDETVHAMVADGENIQLTLGTSSNNLLKVYELSTGNEKLKELSENCLDPFYDRDRCMRMAKPCVLLMVDDQEDGVILASVGGGEWNACKISCIKMDTARGYSITSYFYHVGYLIVGTWSGEVCIIRIENLNNFEKFDLAEMEYKIVQIQDPRNEAVGQIYVTEYNSVPYIIAHTTKYIHVIEFN